MCGVFVPYGWYEKLQVALTPNLAALAAEWERGREDTRLLDWWQEHLQYEHGQDYESGEVILYRVTGSINDREWHEVSRAMALRDALRAAIAKEKNAG